VAPFVAHVPLRWTDQDSYRHVNHARVVTVLEEARIGLFFGVASQEGLGGFSTGLLVAGLGVDYRRQIPYSSRPVRVSLWVDEVRAASFRVSYVMNEGADPAGAPAVRAWTRMATVDLGTARPRRLSAEERAFLARWGDAS
jgi:acyl-CoA thioester hydrolase